jgi:hypothetical protein
LSDFFNSEFDERQSDFGRRVLGHPPRHRRNIQSLKEKRKKNLGLANNFNWIHEADEIDGECPKFFGSNVRKLNNLVITTYVLSLWLNITISKYFKFLTGLVPAVKPIITSLNA